MTKPRYNAALTCLKDAGWTAYRGVCVLPKIGHGKRCKCRAAEFIEVYSVEPNRELA